MKTRSSGVGAKIDLEFDIDSLRIRDLAEDEDYSKNLQNVPSTVYDQPKRNSMTTGGEEETTTEVDPAEGKTVGKIRAETDSTKLREFLGNLGSE